MTFHAGKSLSLSRRKRTERYALIELDSVSDDSRLADDNSRSVIYEEVLADCRPCVYVDARSAVSLFGHHSRYHRDFFNVQHLSDTVYKDCKYPGIR